MLLDNVPVGVVTWTVPLVAPLGTVAWICVSEITVNAAAVPLNLTLVEPVRPLPRILMIFPGPPKLGRACTKGLDPPRG